MHVTFELLANLYNVAKNTGLDGREVPLYVQAELMLYYGK